MQSQRHTLSQLKELFNGLTPGRRLTLVAAPVLVLAGLGLLMSPEAGRDEVPLAAGREFANDELETAQQALRTAGLTNARVVGRRLLAPRQEAARYEATLEARGRQPSPFGQDLDKALERNPLLVNDRQRQELIDAGKAKEVGKIIEQIPQIAQARVLVHRSGSRGFSRETKMSAVLSVTPRPDAEISEVLFESLQQIVAAAWNMKAGDVTVLDTSTASTVGHPLHNGPRDGHGVERPTAASAANDDKNATLASSQTEKVATPSSLADSVATAAADSDRTELSNSGPSSGAPPHGEEIEVQDAEGPAWSVLLTEAARDWGALAGLTGLALCACWTLRTRTTRREVPQDKQRTTADTVPPAKPLDTQHAVLPDSLEPSALPESQETPRDGETEVLRDKFQDASEKSLAAVSQSLPSHGALSRVSSPAASPFQFLSDAPIGQLVTLVAQEHPQTIALVLSFLPAHRGARVLEGLPTTKQSDVARRMRGIESIDARIVAEVEASLRQRMESWSAERVVPPDQTNWPLRRHSASRSSTHTALLEGLERASPELFETGRPSQDFEAIADLPTEPLRVIAEAVDVAHWAVALKGASERMIVKVLGHLPLATAERLRIEMQELGPVRLSDVAAAQSLVNQILEQLEAEGRLASGSNATSTRRVARFSGYRPVLSSPD
ncbi:MAG: FliG C-terminal domain-containing protein [Planctomycetales bacterium]